MFCVFSPPHLRYSGTLWLVRHRSRCHACHAWLRSNSGARNEITSSPLRATIHHFGACIIVRISLISESFARGGARSSCHMSQLRPQYPNQRFSMCCRRLPTARPQTFRGDVAQRGSVVAQAAVDRARPGVFESLQSWPATLQQQPAVQQLRQRCARLLRCSRSKPPYGSVKHRLCV